MRPARWVVAGLLALYLLHNDFWFWHQMRMIAGLPAGFLYHIAYCLAVSLFMILVVRFSWPRTPA